MIGCGNLLPPGWWLPGCRCASCEGLSAIREERVHHPQPVEEPCPENTEPSEPTPYQRELEAYQARRARELSAALSTRS